MQSNSSWSSQDQKANILSPKHKFVPDWTLKFRARFWRAMMALGMFFGRLAPPFPLNAAFSRTIPTTLSPDSGLVKIYFYVPRDYRAQKANGGKKKYPCVINFHGGGFTIGSATDDSRWASYVVSEVEAIVASVDYRLAPEHPFPTAVEDGVDAVMYIAKHAKELHVDPDCIAVSGFSSGGNMAFTVPLRLHEELNPDFDLGNTQDLPPNASPLKSGGDVNISSVITSPEHGEKHPDDIEDTAALNGESSTAEPVKATGKTTLVRPINPINIVAIVSWYPSTDYTRSRDQRRATNIRKDLELSSIFTELFDASYLQPPTMNKSNPYLSPGVAAENLLGALPHEIIMYICEYDMLAAEGRQMRDRLEEIGKAVTYNEVKGKPHGWDKSPNPLKEVAGLKENYKTACKDLRRVFKDVRKRRDEQRKSIDVGKRKSLDLGRISISIPRLSIGVARRASGRDES